MATPTLHSVISPPRVRFPFAECVFSTIARKLCLRFRVCCLVHLENTSRGFALPTWERKVVDVATVCIVRNLTPKSWLHSVLFNDTRRTNTRALYPAPST